LKYGEKFEETEEDIFENENLKMSSFIVAIEGKL
jgi:hypothetical protein